MLSHSWCTRLYKIFRVVNGPEDRNALQEDLGRLSEWSEIWQMKFNVDKCKVMHLGPKNMHWNYSMGGRHLKEATEEKDLGVIITNDLKVEAQCSAACIKANRMLGLIRRTIVNKRHTILTTLYKSLVRPHLEYSTAAWSPHYVKDREMLERVQRRFTRMVPGLGDLEYGERLGVLGLMTLEERRNRSDMVEMYKVLKDIVCHTKGNILRIEWKWQDQRKFVEDCQESYPDGHQEVLLFSESHQPMECSWWEGGYSKNGWCLQEETTWGLRKEDGSPYGSLTRMTQRPKATYTWIAPLRGLLLRAWWPNQV